jgi:hypothetical protein
LQRLDALPQRSARRNLPIPLLLEQKWKSDGQPVQPLGENTTNLILWLIVGGAVGWLISPMLGAGTIHQANFSLQTLLVSLVGLSFFWRSSTCCVAAACAKPAQSNFLTF